MTGSQSPEGHGAPVDRPEVGDDPGAMLDAVFLAVGDAIGVTVRAILRPDGTVAPDAAMHLNGLALKAVKLHRHFGSHLERRPDGAAGPPMERE